MYLYAAKSMKVFAASVLGLAIAAVCVAASLGGGIRIGDGTLAAALSHGYVIDDGYVIYDGASSQSAPATARTDLVSGQMARRPGNSAVQGAVILADGWVPCVAPA